MSAEGDEETLAYDQLVVTLGSTSRTLPIPGLAEHAMGFKTLSEAIALRNRLVQTLETAESIDDDEARDSLLTYVFVGAGYAGVEGLAELQDFAADVLESTRAASCTGVRFMIVEARDRLMPEMSPGLADFAGDELRRRGIEIRLGTTIERVSADSTELSTGEVIPTRTRRLDRGRQAAPDRRRASASRSTTPGGSRSTAYCQVEGLDNVWAIGDAAAVPDPARPGEAEPADLPARDPPGPHGRPQRRRRARRRRRKKAVHVQDAGRVRRHGPPPGGRRDGRDQVARLPGVVPGPHLPPVA